MPKLSAQTHSDAIRHGLNMLEMEIERLTHQVRALKIVNQSLKDNLKACTDADTQKALIEDNKDLTEILERVVVDFKAVCALREWNSNDFNSLRIASEHLQRIKGENNG